MFSSDELLGVLGDRGPVHDTGSYCVIDMGGLPPDRQFMVAALDVWDYELEFNGVYGPLENVVFFMLEVDEGATAGPLVQLLDGQLPLTPCAAPSSLRAPSSAPVPICLLDFDFLCYKSYPIRQGMYLAPDTSFPVPIDQGYFTPDGDARNPCNPTLDNSKPLCWTQAAGGTYDTYCDGAPADAQPMWDTEGPFQNPGWICSFAGSDQPCSGPACVGTITWTRH